MKIYKCFFRKEKELAPGIIIPRGASYAVDSLSLQEAALNVIIVTKAFLVGTQRLVDVITVLPKSEVIEDMKALSPGYKPDEEKSDISKLITKKQLLSLLLMEPVEKMFFNGVLISQFEEMVGLVKHAPIDQFEVKDITREMLAVKLPNGGLIELYKKIAT